MTLRRTLAGLSTAIFVSLLAASASAQSLGTYRWQLQPYCNVVSVTVVQQGAQYQIDGTDDQCGAGQRASVTGLAFFNPDGSIGFGLNLVAAPGGLPVHVTATISPATLSGSWQDSAGMIGTFAFNPSVISGNPRPLPRIGLTSIDPTQVQSRVTGACAAGQLMTGVNEDGTVTCQAVAGGAGGDITAVLAGAGLTGGSQAGDATLAVVFEGDGAATTAARSDHTHALSASTTRVGAGALLAVTTGANNTALGAAALQDDTTGAFNTAVGAGALGDNTTGGSNTATGADTLRLNTTGFFNTGYGAAALRSNTTGARNTGLGVNALYNNTVGINNTATGINALLENTTASNNTANGSAALQNTTTGGGNTAMGFDSLRFNTTGQNNTGIGHTALRLNTNGINNTALGYQALTNNNGGFNTAVGVAALEAHASGAVNTAVGALALQINTAGNDNVAVGYYSLRNALGGNNIALGTGAGATLSAGDGNLYLGVDSGVADESNATYIRNISGATSVDGVAVFVNAAGKMGTLTSSLRYKEDVRSLSGTGAQLQALRPVTFYYKPEFAGGSRVKQYGLIAEEVAETMPDLVVRDTDGAIQTVRYQFLTPLLLAEVQRLERARIALTDEMHERTAMLTRLVSEQAAAMAELRLMLDEMRAKSK
jgi:hypothetical protein